MSDPHTHPLRLCVRRTPVPGEVRAVERVALRVPSDVTCIEEAVAVLTRQVDVVQHRQERLDDAADRHRTMQLAVTVDPLLVVDVLGLQPLQITGLVSREGGVRVALQRVVRTEACNSGLRLCA